MKVLQINETCGTGSIGRTTEEFAKFLVQNGHECHVFYSSGQSAFPQSTRIGNVLDHKLHALLSRITGKQGYFSKIATLRALHRMRELQPDLVHLRNLHGNYIHLGMLLRFLAKNRIPTIITLHDCWFMTGKCTYYIGVGCQKWQTCCGRCPLLKVDRVNPTWFFDRTKKCYLDKRRWFGRIPKLAVVGVSQWVRDEACLSFFKNRNPVAIYNWIDTQVFYPRATQEIKEKYTLAGAFVVLMVTSFVAEYKGYHELVSLAEQLDASFKIVLVGRNNQNHPIPSNILQIPYTADSNELAMLYSAADVCVNTTKYETFGKVTAEALCCGTPAIVYRNTASPELIGESCGYVVDESEGVAGILKAIKAIRSVGKPAYSDACVAFATSKFSMDEACGQYLNLYQKLIETP